MRRVRIAAKPAPRHDLVPLDQKYRAAVDVGYLRCFAGGLGLTADSLLRLGIGWVAEYGVWSFPMCDGAGNICGIQLRPENGNRWTMRGTKNGMFIPTRPNLPDARLMICEGVSDTAAALDLGFDNVIGRVNCTGGVELVTEFVRRTKPAKIVIMADRDRAGIVGANALATPLLVYAPIHVVAPPEQAKDLREWTRQGATQADVGRLIDAAAVLRLKVSATT